MSDVCKTYLGRPAGDLVVVLDGDHTYRLPHIAYHSPTGYAWGYAGSGPADLALSILADYFGEAEETVLGHVRSMWAPRSKAAALHQHFKSAFLEKRGELRIGSLELEAWLALSANATQLQELARLDVELAEIRALDRQEDLVEAVRGVVDDLERA